MRAIVTIIAIVVVIGIIAIATGFVNLHGSPGEAPRVAVEGGKLPSVNADVGSVDVGTRNTTIDVPKVDTVEKKIEVPTVDVKKPH